MYKIYTLSDPLTGLVRYVGCTKKELKIRLILHCNNTSINIQRNPNKYKWILGLRELGVRPLIDILDLSNDQTTAINLECYWTYQMLQWGFPLLNINIGRSLSNNVKNKISLSKAGKPVSEITINASSEKRKKSVIQLTKSGRYVKRWEFIINAANCLNIDRGDISKCCKNENKTAGGFKWKYETEYLNYQNSIK